jgi:ABC-type Fe3+-siderophore transport system permease subunit
MTPRFVVAVLAGMAMSLVGALIFCAWKMPLQIAVILFISNSATGALSALYVYLKLENGVPIPPGSAVTVEAKVQTPPE